MFSHFSDSSSAGPSLWISVAIKLFEESRTNREWLRYRLSIKLAELSFEYHATILLLWVYIFHFTATILWCTFYNKISPNLSRVGLCLVVNNIFSKKFQYLRTKKLITITSKNNVINIGFESIHKIDERRTNFRDRINLFLKNDNVKVDKYIIFGEYQKNSSCIPKIVLQI